MLACTILLGHENYSGIRSRGLGIDPILLINFVHRSEVFHVCEKNCDLHNVIDACTCSMEHML